MNRQSSAKGEIYFLRPVGMKGPIKIGFSAVPESRLRSLMTWSPFPLEIIAKCPGTFGLEQRLHGLLASAHSHSEWFFATDAVLRLVEGLAAGKAINDVIDLNGPFRSLRRGGRKPGWSAEERAAASVRMTESHAWRRAVRASAAGRVTTPTALPEPAAS